MHGQSQRQGPFAERGLHAGAKRILISGPSAIADITLVLGANDHLLGDQAVVSNASCTTNAVAPLAQALHKAFGLVSAHMTTIHCYTGSQPTIDAPRGGFERSRAAALSMVPTTTSAGYLTDLVLPELADRISATSVRVPTASVSAVDLSFQTETTATVDEINTLFLNENKTIFGTVDERLVSSDLRARPESIIMALNETQISKGGLCRCFGWYDNEWGFSNRMIELATCMAKSATQP